MRMKITFTSENGAEVLPNFNNLSGITKAGLFDIINILNPNKLMTVVNVERKIESEFGKKET